MSGTQNPQTNVTLTLQGHSVPCNSFEITSGSYGSVGHATACTSISALRKMGLVVDTLQPSLQQIDMQIAVTLGGSGKLLYGGDLIYTEYDYDADRARFSSRDYAGAMVDERRVLNTVAKSAESVLGPLVPGQSLTSAEVQTENQTLSNIVTSIAGTFGLTPILHLSPSVPSTPTGTIGTGFGSSNTTYLPIPISFWSLLVRLAQDTGNEVFVTPRKELYFGVVGQYAPALNFSYRVPTPTGGALPVRKLRSRHNSRRNTTFRVLVISYNATLGQTTIGRATVIGDDVAGSNGLNSGLYTGSAALTADSNLVALAKSQGGEPSTISPSFFGHVQLYTFHWDGLTNAQANERAAAYAADIMKRSIVIDLEMDLTELSPTQMFTLRGTFADEILDQTFYIASYRHTFDIDRKGRVRHLTNLSALNLPLLAR